MKIVHYLFHWDHFVEYNSSLDVIKMSIIICTDCEKNVDTDIETMNNFDYNDDDKRENVSYCEICMEDRCRSCGNMLCNTNKYFEEEKHEYTGYGKTETYCVGYHCSNCGHKEMF